MTTTYKLYGIPMSLCTRRCALVFKEKNVPYELVPVDVMKGEHKSPEYLAKGQPFGKIPYLVRFFLPMREVYCMLTEARIAIAGRDQPLGDVHPLRIARHRALHRSQVRLPGHPGAHPHLRRRLPRRRQVRGGGEHRAGVLREEGRADL